MSETDSNKIPDNYRQVVAVYVADGNDKYQFFVECNPQIFECTQSERDSLIGALERFCAKLRNPPASTLKASIM